jgi:hypothetical protein
MSTSLHTSAEKAAALPTAGQAPALAAGRDVAAVVASALVVGALANYVIRGGPPGVGATVTVAVLLATMLRLVRPVAGLPRSALALFCAALSIAALFAFRASPALMALNFAALVMALSLLALSIARYRERGPEAWSFDRLEISDCVGAVVRSGINAAGGSIPLLLRYFTALPPARGAQWRAARAAARAALLTAPLLLIFGALLASADPMFERLVVPSLSFDLSTVAGHIFLTACFAWVVGGYLWGAHLGAPGTWPAAMHHRPALRVLDIRVMLGSLDVLFLAFLIVQVRATLGGDSFVIATAGMTYAEYARHGFFQLVAVTALSLPVLLVTRALVPVGDARAERAYRLLAGVLLGLLAAVAFSAMRRMQLYQEEYGLTALRVYASAFMQWLVQLLAVFALTAWRGRLHGFASGALATGCAVLAALNLSNPDALIVRANVARASAGRALDADYLLRLSADAAPALLDALPALDAPDRCRVAARLLHGFGPRPRDAARDWRSWNVARERAWRLARDRRTSLAAMACEAPRTRSRPPAPPPPETRAAPSGKDAAALPRRRGYTSGNQEVVVWSPRSCCCSPFSWARSPGTSICA